MEKQGTVIDQKLNAPRALVPSGSALATVEDLQGGIREILAAEATQPPAIDGWNYSPSSTIPGLVVISRAFTALPLQPTSLKGRRGQAMEKEPVDLRRFFEVEYTAAQGSDYSSAVVEKALLDPATFLDMTLILENAGRKMGFRTYPQSNLERDSFQPARKLPELDWEDYAQKQEITTRSGSRHAVWHLPHGVFYIEGGTGALCFNLGVQFGPAGNRGYGENMRHQDGSTTRCEEGRQYNYPFETFIHTAKEPIAMILAPQEGTYWTPNGKVDWMKKRR